MKSSKYTEESIRKALIELTCQGLEGHRAASFTPMEVADPYFTGFRCEKCKKVVEVLTAALELNLPAPWWPVKPKQDKEVEEWLTWGAADPNPTPPYT